MEPITRETIKTLDNPAFAQYAGMYLDVEEAFCDVIRESGLPLWRDEVGEAEISTLRANLTERGCTVRNCGASFVTKKLSPACEACTTGRNASTYYISLKCHRSCFFCFNPNQGNYEQGLTSKRNLREELKLAQARGADLRYIALTGGEPLLHPDESVDFFETARALFPASHLRLYTSGDLLEEDLCERLAVAGLDEVRFSVKIDDDAVSLARVFRHMAFAKSLIPSLLVEMPVLPGTLDEMKRLLVQLDKAGVDCINLLELCYPLHNVEGFRKRGLSVRYPPYKTYHNYWYAGGVPIAGSELECLRLVEFALEENLDMGVHYCSLENKHFGQIYRQNARYRDITGTMEFSKQDFFLKTVKAFGRDVQGVRDQLAAAKEPFLINEDFGFIQMHPSAAKLLDPEVELGLSYQVAEVIEGESALRELRVDLTSPDDKGLDSL